MPIAAPINKQTICTDVIFEWNKKGTHRYSECVYVCECILKATSF